MDMPTAWEALYRVLEIAYENRTELFLDEEDNAFVTIEHLERDMHGCGCCNNVYPSFFVKGHIRTNYLEKPLHPYDASIYIELCLARPVEELNFFDPLFRGYVKETRFPIFHHYIRTSPCLQHFHLNNDNDNYSDESDDNDN